MNSIYLMVGKMAYDDKDYEGLMAIEQCKRGAQRLGVKWEEVTSTSRKRRIVDARRLCCSHLRSKGWTYDMISEAVGYTNHATALHHVRVTDELLNYDEEFKRKATKFRLS